MFTPELVDENTGSYILIANHFVENDAALELSIAYNLARIRFGSNQLPDHINKCMLVYDLRGQKVELDTIDKIESAFSHVYKLEIKQ